jgi:hypothetical protein
MWLYLDIVATLHQCNCSQKPSDPSSDDGNIQLLMAKFGCEIIWWQSLVVFVSQTAIRQPGRRVVSSGSRVVHSDILKVLLTACPAPIAQINNLLRPSESRESPLPCDTSLRINECLYELAHGKLRSLWKCSTEKPSVPCYASVQLIYC